MSGDYAHSQAESIRVQGQWKDLGESMGRALGELTGATTAGLPPGVTAAASAFLTIWRDLADHSQGIAEDFAASLDMIDRRYATSDDQAEARFDALRGQLGTT